jgi:hypothetical protein
LSADPNIWASFFVVPFRARSFFRFFPVFRDFFSRAFSVALVLDATIWIPLWRVA